jgi:hypothetical protein
MTSLACVGTARAICYPFCYPTFGPTFVSVLAISVLVGTTNQEFRDRCLKPLGAGKARDSSTRQLVW